MEQSVTAFLPCRKGSERVPRKNIRPFGSFEHGLVEIKLRQLLDCPVVDRVVLSTNDPEILDYARNLGNHRLQVHHRDDALGSSKTSTDDLVSHALSLIPEGHIMWTHVTSPFVGATLYTEVIAAYHAALGAGYDSLMSTTPLHTFLWDKHGPINYNRSIEKWPRTQMLEPVHEVNSAIFLAHVQIYADQQDRVGIRPKLFEMDPLQAIDIDWETDFIMAETLLTKGLVTP
jgi:CMP-N-acetylneuraminic acid synthetase